MKTPSALRTLALVCVVLFATACEDIKKIDSGQLDVQPAELFFPKPDPGSDSRRLAIELTNVGKANVIIAGATLVEDDATEELALVDRDDWQQPQTIAPDETLRLFVDWVATDAQADTGRVTITHNAGEPVVVPLRTTDIDPCIEVTTEPMGEAGDAETRVDLNGAIAGRFQRARVEIRSTCLAPLNLEQLCLEDPDGRGGDCSQTVGQFTICDGAPQTPIGCTPPRLPSALIYDTTYVFYTFFTAPENDESTLGVDLRIQSNAAIDPIYKVKLRGQACQRRMASDMCEGCGNGQVDIGEQCDDGNLVDNDTCRNNCTSATCGDGFVQVGEECDGGDDCTRECTFISVCGNGSVERGEECDDGNDDDTDGCIADCREANGANCGERVCDVDGAVIVRALTEQSAKHTADDAAVGGSFGFSVAISGDTAIVGASGDDHGGRGSGSAYIFARAADGTWSQTAKLTAADAAAHDYFGYSVAISGDTVIVGALRDENGLANSGSAYIFSRAADDTWSQTAKLTAADAAAGDGFGFSVAISGDTVIVGAMGDDDGFADSGSAYIFSRAADGTWNQTTKLTAADAAADDRFGRSVGISGDAAIAGAPWNDERGEGSGSAYIFAHGADGNWTQTAKLIAADAAAYDYFGHSVAISRNTAIVGAHGDDAGFADSGSAYIFTRGGDGTWTQATKLTAADAGAGDLFGYSVDISGDTAIVGANWDDHRGERSGSAFVFTRGGDGTWTQTAKLTADDTAANDEFGYSGAISHDTAIVGAYGNDDGGLNSGSTYIFFLGGLCTNDGACICVEGAAGELCSERPDCGDAVVQHAEQCDDGDNNGVIDCAYGEQACQVCSNQCMQVAGETRFCGDGVVDEANGEECDGSFDCSDGCIITGGLDCADIHAQRPDAPSGIYRIDPDGDVPGTAFDVYCEMNRDGGGWTLVAVSSDDGQDTWTWNNRNYWDTDRITFGSLDDLSTDFKSRAHHEVLFSDILFVHAPSDVWASYHDVADLSYLAIFIGALGGPIVYREDQGYPLTAGNLEIRDGLCSDALFFNAADQDPTRDDHSWGPTWNTTLNESCPFDDPGWVGGLGPLADLQNNGGHRAPRDTEFRALGFGEVLGLNAGAPESGENNMRVYVRR